MDFGIHSTNRWSTRGPNPKTRAMPQNTAAGALGQGSGNSLGSGSPPILTRNRSRKSIQIHGETVRAAPQFRKRGWDAVDNSSICSHEVAEETSPTRPTAGFLNFSPHPLVAHPSGHGRPGAIANSSGTPAGGTTGRAYAPTTHPHPPTTNHTKQQQQQQQQQHCGSSQSLGTPVRSRDGSVLLGSSHGHQGSHHNNSSNQGNQGGWNAHQQHQGGNSLASHASGGGVASMSMHSMNHLNGGGSISESMTMRSSTDIGGRERENSLPPMLGTPLLPPETPERCQLTPQLRSRDTRRERPHTVSSMSVTTGPSYDQHIYSTSTPVRHSMSGSLTDARQNNGMIPWPPLGSQGKMEMVSLCPPKIDSAMLTTTLVTPQSPQLSIGGGTDESKSPVGGPLANANWEGYAANFQQYRHFGSGSLGSATSVSGHSPLVKSTTFGSQGSPSQSGASCTAGIFSNIGKLDFSAAMRSVVGPCTCCRVSNRIDMVDVNSVKIPYITIKRPYQKAHSNFALELWEAFGEDVLEKIFEEGVKPADVRCLANAGLNHEFIAIAKNQLFKLIVPKNANLAGEAHEMEFIRKQYPEIARDKTVCFPRKCFRLITNGSPPVYDVVVLDYHEGAMSLREVIQAYERAAKEDKAWHQKDVHSLIGDQAARILRRYQHTHSRKHGDAKSDNILVTRDGSIVMCDMGSTFNDTLKPCDRDEFLRSIPTLDPMINGMKSKFEETFRSGDTHEITMHEKKKNAALMKAVKSMLRSGGSTPPMGGGLLGAGGMTVPPLLGTGANCIGNNLGINPNPGMGAGMQIRLGNAPGGMLNANLASQNLLGAAPALNAPSLQAGNLLNAFNQSPGNPQNSPVRP